jgi:hypothetical protein
MNPNFIHAAAVAIALAAALLLLVAPLPAHGEAQPRDAHEVPPFAKGRTEIVQERAAAE